GDYRRIVPQLSRLMAPGGCAVLEIGHTQADVVYALAAEQGLSARVYRDLGDRPRAIRIT
ncbi:MAG TPA: peptide chain release factor N(5)-glutamine methyltransferase, partial [Sphingomonas sp.]|nr:peptide chain release factor N(5)-glutamine methyltransferase [Sphingomonas sp.]